MAEEILVKDILTKEMIEAGSYLTRLLDEHKLNVQASLWMYLVDSNNWRFIIATPESRTDGPKRIYTKIQSVLSKMPSPISIIALKDVSVLDTNDPLISLLKKAIKTKQDTTGIRFSKNTIDGHFIEDSYIYRLV